MPSRRGASSGEWPSSGLGWPVAMRRKKDSSWRGAVQSFEESFWRSASIAMKPWIGEGDGEIAVLYSVRERCEERGWEGVIQAREVSSEEG